MSNTNLLGSEEWAVVATVDPDANTAAAYSSDEIDMSLFEQILVVTMAGTIAAAGTIDTKIQSATTSGGTFADVTNKSATQLTGSPDTANDAQTLINLRGDELTEGHRYVKVVHTVGGATGDSAVVVLGKGKSLPSSDNDLATVAEIVS